MKQAQPGWELYRSFLAVVREGSLSGAARALSLTQPTIGRHIDALEAGLGVSLFTRSQAGLIASDGASLLVPYAEAMANAADALQRAASGEAQDDRGTVRVTASEMIGGEVLPSVLTAFREAHPRVIVELVLSNRTEDLLRREADIAVRMVRPSQTALFARKVGVIHLGFHAHPRYLKAHGAPKTLRDIAKHSCIGIRLPTAETIYRWELERRGRVVRVDVPCRLVVDGMRFAALAAKGGLGLAYVDEPWVADDVARGQLRVVLPQLAAHVPGLYLYYPQVSRRSPRVRALVEAARAH